MESWLSSIEAEAVEITPNPIEVSEDFSLWYELHPLVVEDKVDFVAVRTPKITPRDVSFRAQLARVVDEANLLKPNYRELLPHPTSPSAKVRHS